MKHLIIALGLLLAVTPARAFSLQDCSASGLSYTWTPSLGFVCVQAGPQRKKLTLAADGSANVWTFKQSFSDVPAVACTPENTVGAVQPYVVNTANITTSSTSVMVFQAQQTTISSAILGLGSMVLKPFLPAGVVTVDCFAALPTAP